MASLDLSGALLTGTTPALFVLIVVLLVCAKAIAKRRNKADEIAMKKAKEEQARGSGARSAPHPHPIRPPRLTPSPPHHHPHPITIPSPIDHPIPSSRHRRAAADRRGDDQHAPAHLVVGASELRQSRHVEVDPADGLRHQPVRAGRADGRIRQAATFWNVTPAPS